MGVMAAHLLLTLLLAGPAHLTPETPQGLEVRGHTSLRETPEPFKVVVSEGCVTSGSQQEGKELELQPGGSLVLTHRISLRTPSGPGACGCQEELGRVLGRLEGLEREVSALRASCSAGGGCCSSSTESKGAGCLVQPDPGAPRLCPGGCSDQGRCVGGACECFHGYSGPDCSRTPCPADCSDRGRCVDGGCECDPGYTGPDCSLGGCPGNCNGRGRCVNGACACSTGFTGLDCSEESCPSNCNERGQCLNGECVCGPEFKGPDCSERSCPDNCRGHGQCVEGQCVCDPGFKGPDCSEKSCPSNCNARGSCLNGKCVCDPEFTGPDCSKKSCPSNCNKRGRCLNGKCACNPEFTGPDCSERSCPDNCNDRGRCVKGECVCDPGFTGPDCSEKSCPSNCHARGRCIDGQCSCDPEFTGPDCSEESCPSNCNKRGRCLNGKCICDPEFTGPDCSEKSCPSNCHARGRCIDGQCSCDPEFTGTDCSEKSCPDNCNDRGRCVKGQCVCDPEFRGPDCSEKSCPDNCNKRGQCVNGKCACNPKFTGSDCSERSCPGNCSGRGRCEAGRCVCDAGSSGAACAYRSCPAGCSGRGRCVEGRCVCRRAFSGADCGRCADGVTGPRCDQALSAVTGVMVDDITETSVILLWTPPPVEYQTYHITFTSEKDGEQQIRAQVPGGAVRYSQTGLAAGQAYTATIAGEMDGRAGAAHSVTFSTPPSGPTDLRVVKTSTSSAVVQWEPAQGPIDRYHLTVSPNDGAGKAQEMALPPGRDSAHIQHLEAGRLYDITLRAESGAGQSATAAAQVTPGETLPGGALVTVTVPPPPAPPRADGDLPLKPGSSVAGSTRPRLNSSSTATARAPPLGRFLNGLKPKAGERGGLARRPGAPLRLNGSRAGPGWSRAEAGPLKKAPGGAVKKEPTLVLKRRPGRPVGGGATPETPSDHSGSRGDPRDQGPGGDPRDPQGRGPGASSVSVVANPSREDGRTRSEENTVHPEVALVTGRDQEGGGGPPEGSAPRGGGPTEEGVEEGVEEECLNKVTVSLPYQEEGGRGGGGAVGVGCGSPGGGESPPGGGRSPGGGESPGGGATPTPKDLSSHHLHQLLTDTFDSLNIKTFSVHLSEPADFALNADSVSDQILAGMMPISAPASSSSSSLRTFYSSVLVSPNSPPRPPWSSQTPASPHSPSSSASSELPTATTSTASPFHSSQEEESLGDGKERSSDTVRARESDTEEASVREARPPPTLPPQPPKHAAFQRRQHLASFRNRTRFHTRPALALNSSPGKESSPSHTSLSSEDPLPPRRALNGDANRAAMVKVWTKRNQTTIRRQDGPGRHANANGGTLQKPTHPKLRWSKLPTRPRNTETQDKQQAGITSPAPSSSFSSGDPDPVSGSQPSPGPGGDGGRSGAEPSSAVAALSPGESAAPGPRARPHSAGYTRRTAAELGLLQNRTRPPLRAVGLLRRPAPPRRPNGDRDGITDQVQISQSGGRDSLPQISGQSEEQDHVHSSAHKTTTAEPTDQGPTGENLGSGSVTRRVHRKWTEPGENIKSGSPDYPPRFETSQSGPRISNERLVPEEAGNTLSEVDSPSLDSGGSTRSALSTPDRVSLSGSEALAQGAPPPTTAPQQRTSLTGRIPANQSPPPRRSQNTQSQQSWKRLQSQGPQAARPPMNAAPDAAGGPHTRPRSGVPPPGSPRKTLREPQRERARERAREPLREPAREPAREPVGEPLKEPQREPKVPLRDPLREPQREPKEPLRDPLREPLREPQREPKEPLRDPLREPLREPQREPKEPLRDPLREPLGEPLDYVGVRHRMADGFELVWAAPEGKYSSFVVTRSEEDGHTAEERSEERSEEEEEEGEEPPEEAGTHRGAGEENAVPESDAVPEGPGTGLAGSDPLFSRELPGSARSFLFERLAPLTPFSVTLQGRGAGLMSRLHRLVISTGPSPPTALAFSQVSEDSLRLTWTGPPAPVSGFKVTYTHTGEGEPISVVVGSQDSSLSLSQLTPGSSYEVSVISVLGLDESDPIKETVTTLPDPPSGLQVLNVTDSKALLLWRPATAAVDEYSIVYGTGERSDLRVTVSGNVVEKHLTGLEESTTYSVTITSLLGDTHSSPSTASFTTTQGEEEEEEEEGGAQHFQARQVTPRTALLSWEPPAATAVDRYRLTYQTEGEEPKEVTLNATTTNHKLRRLRPGSSYTATLRGERDGRPGPPVPAHFNTGPLRFPHPADCSEELLNGEGESGEVEVFLGGAPGVPLPVYCDMETDGGGWTVFQRRSDGAVDFFRGWKDYVKGFGELGGEFWMGLDNLHLLTSGADMSLRVDLRDGEEAAYARYSTFRVAKRNYRLSVAGYSGTAGDSMSYHSGRPFSTRDRDPDRSITRCAVSYRGGWWYWNCHKANLNGLYGSGERHQGVIWTTWKGKDFSVPFTEMKMRPSAFIPPAR